MVSPLSQLSGTDASLLFLQHPVIRKHQESKISFLICCATHLHNGQVDASGGNNWVYCTLHDLAKQSC
jgi:hypothetical protein